MENIAVITNNGLWIKDKVYNKTLIVKFKN